MQVKSVQYMSPYIKYLPVLPRDVHIAGSSSNRMTRADYCGGRAYFISKSLQVHFFALKMNYFV